MKVEKEKLIFPGGGTQFKYEGGALRYINFVEEVILLFDLESLFHLFFL